MPDLQMMIKMKQRLDHWIYELWRDSAFELKAVYCHLHLNVFSHLNLRRFSLALITN